MWYICLSCVFAFQGKDRSSLGPWFWRLTLADAYDELSNECMNVSISMYVSRHSV